MPLVRCTCLVAWTRDPEGRPAVDVQVLDPECTYVVHRAFEAMLDPTA